MSGKRPLPTLGELKRVHIVGVCGTLMGAFAAFLKRRGVHVTGSDQNVYPPMSDVLRDAGVVLYSGYDAANLRREGPDAIDLVVIGNVVRSDNPEAREALDQGYRYSSLPEAMETLMLRQTRNLVVSGTHGKTTTSGLLSHILVCCKKEPGYFIGGVVKDLPFSFNVPSIDAGRYFVLEGDEYDTAFWDKVPKFNHYLPDDVILTSVEYDHADIYPDFQAVFRAFEGLVARVRPGGRMICCMDYGSVRDLSQKANVPVIGYGSQPGPGIRFWPANVRGEDGQTFFDVIDNGRKVDSLELSIPGNHNILNALAAWIECRELGLPAEQVRAAILSFQGVKRRQEVRGTIRDILVIDDFAHHPTAVRVTLQALKQKYPGRRLLAVFEPRSATSRRKVFQQQYAEAFDESHGCFIAAPYDQTRISSQDQFSSEQLVADINGRWLNGSAGRAGAHLMPDVENGVAAVAALARPGDLIAVLSNGGFGGFIPKLLDALQGKG